MPACTICGKGTGFTGGYAHENCLAHRQLATERITVAAHDCALGKVAPSEAAQTAAALRGDARFSDEDVRVLQFRGIGQAVDEILAHDLFTRKQEDVLKKCVQELDLAGAELDAEPFWAKALESAVLREVLDGGLPPAPGADLQFPFDMEFGEVMIWWKGGVIYSEVRTVYAGATSGMMLPLGLGIGYQIGRFQAAPIETSQTQQVGVGVLAIATRHLYFSDGLHGLKIDLEHIVSFYPFDDGLAICCDHPGAIPQTFLTGDGWFFYPLVRTLARRRVREIFDSREQAAAVAASVNDRMLR